MLTKLACRSRYIHRNTLRFGHGPSSAAMILAHTTGNRNVYLDDDDWYCNKNKDERLDHRVKKGVLIEFSISLQSKLMVLPCFIMRICGFL